MKSSFGVMQDIIRMETVGELNKIRGKVLSAIMLVFRELIQSAKRIGGSSSHNEISKNGMWTRCVHIPFLVTRRRLELRTP